MRVSLKSEKQGSHLFTQNFTLTVWDYEDEITDSEPELTGRIIDPRKQLTFLRRQEPLDVETEALRPVPYVKDVNS